MTDIYRVRLAADSRDIRTAKRDVDNLDRAGVRAQSTFRSATRTISAFASALAIGQTFRAVIANTIEQERVTAQLEATLRSTGRYTPELSKSLQEYASELQKVSTFGDEAIISAQSLLLTFTKVGGEAFPRATQAILDTATAMGQDLRTATLQIGRALNDPITGLSALTRSGIQFSDVQKEMIKDMVAVGDVAGAQSIILKELETQFGGSAKAARDTFGGAIQGLKNAFGDLLEAKGGLPEATDQIERLTQILQDPKTIEMADKLTSGLVAGMAAVIDGSIAAIGFLEKLDEISRKTLGSGLQDVLIKANPALFSATALYGLMSGSGQENQAGKRFPVPPRPGVNDHVPAVGSVGVIVDEEAGKDAQALQDRINKQAQTILDSLMDEETAIRTSYERRREILLQSSIASTTDLLALEAQKDAQLLELAERREEKIRRAEEKAQAEKDARNARAQSIIDSLLSEEDAIELSYQRRREILLESTIATNEDLIALENEKNARLQELDDERARQTYQNYANLFGGLAGLTKAFAGEQSGIYRAMFAVSKAFSIAEAIVAIQTGIAKAAATPWPTNLAAMASVAAATSGIISTIASTNPSFEGGGFTGYGSRSGGVDGRGGFPAVLHPNETIIDHTKGGGGQQPNAVRIINVLDPSVVGDYLDTDAGEEIIMNVVRRNQGGQ
jgi:hypothetical protein